MADFLRRFTHANAIKGGDTLPLEMNRVNVGTGKLYLAYTPRLFLLDAAGRACFASDDSADPHQ